MKTKAIYAGSFDPITYGHLDIIERGVKLFDHLIIGVGKNPSKKYSFSIESRIEMIKECTKNIKTLEILPFAGLLIDFAKAHNCQIIIRGLRALTDFDFEFQLGLTNMDIEKDIETIFLLTNPKNIFISSSMVKEIAENHGDLKKYVPINVENNLKKLFSNKKI